VVYLFLCFSPTYTHHEGGEGGKGKKEEEQFSGKKEKEGGKYEYW